MKTLTYLLLIPAVLLVASCGQPDDGQEGKMEQLQALRKQAEDLQFQIQELERELQGTDSTAKENELATPVTTLALKNQRFDHFIEVQGTVQSDDNISISAENGGSVEYIKVNEGQKVEKGQLLLKIDDAVILREIDDLQNSLELAKTVYTRQENLWKQKIGSEMQYLQAKNNKESLEKKLAKARTQLEKTNIKSPISGTVDEIFINEGEMAAPGRALIRVVNLGKVQAVADVPEDYIGSVKKGDEVMVKFPALKLEKKATITSVGQVISPANRTFRVEAAMDNKGGDLKANLLAVIKISDYRNNEVIVVPTHLIQQSGEHNFVFVVKNENAGKTALRRQIEPGRTYDGVTEVLAGLKAGEEVIAEGSRELVDGEPVFIQ